MTRLPIVSLAFSFLFTAMVLAEDAKPPAPATAPPPAEWFDLNGLQKVSLADALKNGTANCKSDCPSVTKEADERIAAIMARPGYSDQDYEMLASPWVRTKEFVELMKQGRRLPEIKLAFRGHRNGVFDTGGTHVFKGDAKRALEIMREIGLRDTANGKSWSEMWGIMERAATVLGQRANGDIAVRVDVVLGVNQWFNAVYKQIYNVRDIERYAERDMGEGRYIIYQDMIRDDSAGTQPRGSKHPERPPKPYYPIKEQISITVICDNKDGTFSLGNFMSTHGQEMKASGAMKIGELFFDLLTIMEKDTIKNREKWNELFQKEVLAKPKG